MKMIYYLAIIEFDQDKVDEKNGPAIIRVIKDLQAVTGNAGCSSLWQVKDEQAIQKFKRELMAGMHT